MDPTPTDYTTWTNADLIQRVTTLEARLRARNDRHPSPPPPSSRHPLPSSTTSTTPSLAPPRKKVKKAAKGFDPRRYHTRVIALKFAYLGSNYNGFEHHSGNATPLPTVEETLWRALRKTKLIFPDFPSPPVGGRRDKERGDGEDGEAEEEEVCWEGVEYSKCGRTDRGVSAFGQVVGLRVRSARPKREEGDDEGGESGTGVGAGSGRGVGRVGWVEGATRGREGDVRMTDSSSSDGRVTGDGDAGAGVAAPGSVADGPAGVAGEAEVRMAGSGGRSGSNDRGAQHPSQPPPRQQQQRQQREFDPIRDELPYIQVLNRVLPPDIRVLAWCPDPPVDFSARFHCRERRYRYFFTNPAYVPLPGSDGIPSSGGGDDGERGGAWLDIAAMRMAAAKYEGLHDFRNLCKIDASKQITNFERRIFHAGIHEAYPGRHTDGAPAAGTGQVSIAAPKLYYFEVRGSAFLWHQVRHLVAILFLVGQRYEQPSLVDELLDVVKNPSRPLYDMASDTPLVLWDCIFPQLAVADTADHGDHGSSSPMSESGYTDALNWVYVGDEAGGRYQPKRPTDGTESGKHGRGGVMESLWTLWRKQKMHEILAWNLMDVVNGQGESVHAAANDPPPRPAKTAGARVFEGSELPRSVGKYVPVMQRDRMEPPEVVNARYAARKGLNGVAGMGESVDP